MALAFALGAALPPSLLGRPKTDVLVMKNGDRITCEITKLQRGQLSIKTDYTLGTTSIDWAQVDRIESSQLFQVELMSGTRLSGAIVLDETTHVFTITGESDVAALDPLEVVVVEQLGRNFLQGLDGGLDFGLSATKSNSEAQLSFNGNLQRRTRKNLFSGRMSSILSRHSGGEATNRNNVTFNYSRFFARSWLAGGVLDLLQSDEQELDLRTIVGGFAGRHFLRTSFTDLVAFGGPVVTREKYSPEVSEEEHVTNLEAALGASLGVYRFDATQIDFSLLFYPSITDGGRYRTNTKLDVYWEVWGDLYLRLSFFFDFDSRSPITGATSTDLGGTSSVGWTF